MKSLIAVDNFRKPGGQFRPEADNDEPDELKDDKGNDSFVKIHGLDLGRTDAFEVKERRSKGRRHKRSLKVDGKHDAEPERVKPVIHHNGGNDGNVNIGDFYEIQKKTKDKDKNHDHGDELPPGKMHAIDKCP